MNQTTAREKIQELIEKFHREEAAGVIGQYNESEAKTGFIEPLLQALGWNTQNRNEVGLEEKISRDRAHVRHEYTNYDELLMRGWDRLDARAAVQLRVEEISNQW